MSRSRARSTCPPTATFFVPQVQLTSLGSAAPVRGLQLQSFSCVPVPVGPRPTNDCYALARISCPIRERPFPEWTGRSTGQVPPTAWGRTRPLERRTSLTGLRTTADLGNLVGGYESVTRHLESFGGRLWTANCGRSALLSIPVID